MHSTSGSHKTSASGSQHRHPVPSVRHQRPAVTMNVQHSTSTSAFDIQHSTSSSQHPAFDIRQSTSSSQHQRLHSTSRVRHRHQTSNVRHPASMIILVRHTEENHNLGRKTHILAQLQLVGNVPDSHPSKLRPSMSRSRSIWNCSRCLPSPSFRRVRIGDILADAQPHLRSSDGSRTK